MLVSLHVKNVALIDEVEVYFDKGLNILSGETGAGKSIVIGSINLALGDRAGADIIRTGAPFAFIELVFQITDQEQIKMMREMDIPVEEDGMILLQRRIMPGRSVSKICGEIAPVKKVRELAGYLINIHGQSETQTLFDTTKQREYVDSYAGEELEAELEAFELEYREYIQFKKKVDAFDKDERTSMKEYDLAKYELNEIEEAELQVGEDENLEQSYRKMQNSQNIMTGLQEANMLLDDSDGMLERSARILRALKSVSEYDEDIEAIFESMNDADSILSDASREISDYIGNSEFSGEEFHEVENRLNTINHLKDKYGKSIDEVLKYRDSLEETIEQIENKDRYFEEYKRKLEESEVRMLDLADKVTNIRKKYAEELQEAISKALLGLNFQRADFQISIEKKEVCSIHGQDDIVFMISTNLGQPIKPLSSVASGGELSRIMLALKTVMAKNDAVDSIIFDEIDAGVSGKTAWKVSEKLGAVAVNQQVICITHLPQIAAMADVHYLIEKTNTNDSTVTDIRQLEEAESLHELARMLGGEHITEAAKENAKEMKILAKRAKIND